MRIGIRGFDDDNDDDAWYSTAVFVHMVGYMGKATSKGNEIGVV